MKRPRPAAHGLVTWGWYSVTAGALREVGGSVPGLVPAGEETAFWAAWWTEDPRRSKRPVAPDAFGFFTGPKASFVAGCEAESRIRREKSAAAYVISIPESYARGAYNDGAPRLRSKAKDWKKLAGAWCKEHGLPASAAPDAIKAAWRTWLKENHGGAGAKGMNLDVERRRYDVALKVAEERQTEQLRKAQAKKIAAGERPVDHQAVARAIGKRATAIAEQVRASLVAFAEHFNINKELGGLCHFAALGLVEALRADGLHAVVASTGGHSWANVLLEGGLSPILVDVTATQFGLAPVYVRLPWQRPHALYEVRIKGTRCAIEAQKAADGVIERAPANWWSIPPWDLPAALKRAGTQLTECGERVLTRTVVVPLDARKHAVRIAQVMREMEG